ncbi:MAG: L,D-transpeptidase [Myxococcales bacterium]|nr:L,D-transpeptidase [Myxococcales bacterium]
MRFVHRAVVRKEPRASADPYGVAKKGTRAAALRALPAGAGCRSRWIEIEPRGFVCEDVLEPSELAPTAQLAPTLDATDEPAVKGVYGIVRGKSVQAFASVDAVRAGAGRVLEGSNTVRAAGSAVVDGERYWRTSRGELIRAASIVQMSPSRFEGVSLPSGAGLPAWIRGHAGARKPVTTRATPSARGAITGSLAPRTLVTIEEESADGRFVRVGTDAWIDRRDVRRATLAAPPPGTAAGEKWLDVDLDEQTLVAYEGERPVFATLVSTGKWGHVTPTGVARIASKHEAAAMTNDQEGEAYSVADVPWTMYYDRDFALHTSYWHDGFGGPRSHGCVNLAPGDARRLFQWSSPDVPAGWSTVYGDAENPGTLVRVRSRAVAEPAFRGYAKQLRERDVTISQR